MTDLPAGWASTTVRDVSAAMFDGPFGSALKTSDYTDDGMRVARLENIGHLEFRRDLKSYVSASKGQGLSRHVLRRADVLFSSFVDRQTRVCLVPDDLDGRMINKADCFCVRVNPSVCDPRFVAYRLAAPSAYETFVGAVKGVTRPRIGMRDLAAFELELPPLAEQQRIVAKLDALTARTTRARADLDRVPALAERQRRAILNSLFSRGWPEAEIGEITTDIRYGTAAKCAYEPKLVPVLRIPNVARGRVDTTDLKYGAFPPNEVAKLALRIGDILVIRSNGSLGLVGRPAIVEGPAVGMLFAGYLIRLRLDERQVLPEFINLALQAGQTRDAIEAAAKSSSGVNNVNSEELRRLLMPLPPLEAQRAAVRQMAAAFAEIDRLVAEAAAARRLLDRLDQAILAKAFRGELVPQDPADEPASVLLDRIRAERASTPTNARRGRPVAA